MVRAVQIDFTHRQFAHCETGAMANLLYHHGIPISEALVFGIGSGLFFGYFPFIKVHGLPLITFRNAPGKIIRNTARRLGLSVKRCTFKDPVEAMDGLDNMLERGIPVGIQAGVYWLPYFPSPLRFHFNAHTLVVYGMNGADYLISDPVFDDPVVCSRRDLMKARFAEGMLAPKGKMYYLGEIPDHVEYGRAVRKGMRETCRAMVKIPVPLIGVRGIRLLAGKVEKWPGRYGERRASQHLGHTIRMQEEIGTGGGGFRFMYAAFLQEAAEILPDDRLLEMSERMTAIGNRWREFALLGARICKGRSLEGDDYGSLTRVLVDCAAQEERFYRDLMKVIG